MGDEENFDLDDELGLGDDGGDDDFGSSLDDMLDDDDAGDGDDGGGDGGLDAFFEDLSNIDEMEGGDPEPDDAPAPAAAPAAAMPAAPQAAAPQYAAAPQKSGGMMKWILILLILGGGGAGGWWYMNQPPVEEFIDEGLPTEVYTPPQEEVIQVVQQRRPVQVQQVVEVEPPPVRAANYLVQVATCSFSKCRDEYANDLRRDGIPVYFKSSGEKFDFIEVISKQLFSLRDAQNWAKKINQVNERAGVANIARQTNGYRVSLGTFTSLDKAKDMKLYLDEVLNKQLPLNMEHVEKNYETIKIFAGPYETRNRAKEILNQLRKQNRYRTAFLVRK